MPRNRPKTYFDNRAKAEDHLIRAGWTPPTVPTGEWSHYAARDLRAAIRPIPSGDSTVVYLQTRKV